MRTHPDLGKCTVKSDALTRVLGKERLGRVRGFGFAATPSKLALQAITHSNVSQPESRLNDLHAKYNELQASFINYMRTHEVMNVYVFLYMLHLLSCILNFKSHLLITESWY